MRATCIVPVLLLALAGFAPAKEARLKPGKVHALKTKKHGRAYSLFVPSKYSKKSSWPLVISSHGRGGSGAKEMRPWQGLANSHGFIVACPDMVTATHNRPKTSELPASEEDDEVLMSIVEEVSSRFRVNRRAVMITGFSGGGNPSYHTGLRHPDVFTHICTRGGNFAPQQIPTDDKVLAAGRKTIRIYIFFGDKDHELIIGPNGNDGQAHMARDALKEAGYENITFERVPGMGHQSRPQMAAKWFGEYVTENKKRFKAGDRIDGYVRKAKKSVARKKWKAAVADLLKARKLEEKHGLTSVTKAELDAIDAEGNAILLQAGLKKDAQPGEALKICKQVMREFKGLPVADVAKGAIAEWQLEEKK